MTEAKVDAEQDDVDTAALDEAQEAEGDLRAELINWDTLADDAVFQINIETGEEDTGVTLNSCMEFVKAFIANAHRFSSCYQIRLQQFLD